MSFSAEMKDFLTAYKTGQGINASRTDQEYKDATTERTKATTARENDPETLKIAGEKQRADLELTRARIANSGAARGATGASAALTGARAELVREQLRQLRQGATAGTGLLPPDNPAGPTGPVPQGQGALPIGPSTLSTGVDEYAEGGLVPDDEEDELTPDSEPLEGEGVLPTAPVAAPAAAPTDVSAQSRRREPQVPRGLEGVISPALVHDATKAGMKFGIESFGLNNPGVLKSPQARQRAQQFAQGVGGLTEQEMAAAKQTVDPEGKLTDSQRNMAALGSVYQYWANKGEPQKAQKVAFQMLQYYRNAAQRYAAIAAKAAEGGNVDLATKAALKAYANVPDGNDLELLPNPDGGIMYAYTDSKGDVITKGVATPQQLAASAMGLATGGFDKAILAAAGAREAPAEATKSGGGGALKPGDRAKEAENAAVGVEALKTKWQEKNKDAPVDDTYWGEMGDIAQHIMQQNPKVTSREAANAAMTLITPNKSDPEKQDFKLIPGEEGAPSVVKFKNGAKIELDDSQLEVILNARAMRRDLAVADINKKMEESDKPGFLDKAGKAAGAAWNAASNIASDAAPAVATMGRIAAGAVPTELKERIGSDLSKIGSMLERNTRNTGAIPVDDNDRPL